MTKFIRLRTALSATTILAAGLIVAAAPARAQNLPDTGNVTAVTSGLSGGAPGSTNPTFTTTGTPGAQTLRVDLKDNRTILNWSGTGFDIATGNTVDFKDARATSGVSGRTDNIAVLNRDLSGSASGIYGNLRSDPNVAVYVINQSGILFGDNASVNTGAFFASTANLTDDNSFLNGASSLRFLATNGDQTVSLGSASFTTTGNAGTTGGQMGDLVFIGQVVRMAAQGATTLTANGGDIALVAARDVSIHNAPGSPLSITITAGAVAPSSDLIYGTGTITGRNVTMAAALVAGQGDVGITVQGTLSATGATATDRGVVLTVGQNAPGVAMASASSEAANAPIGKRGSIAFGSFGNSTPLMTSAKDIWASANSVVVLQPITATNDITLAGANFEIERTTIRSTVQAANIHLNADATEVYGSLRTTTGDINIANRINFHEGSLIHAARDIFSNTLRYINAQAPLVADRDVNITMTSTLGGSFGAQNLTAGRDIRVTAMGMFGGTWEATTGSAILNGQNSVSVFRLKTGIDARLWSVGDVTLRNATIGNDLIVNGPGYIYNATVARDIVLNIPSNNSVFLGGDLDTYGVVHAGRDIVATGGFLSTKGNISADNNISADLTGSIVAGNFDGSASTIEAGETVTLKLAGPGQFALRPGLSINARDIILSTPGGFTNTAGANVLNASGHWVIYTANPNANTYGGLNSGNTALWGSTLATRDPSAVSGNRYVFALAPTLTFSTQNLSKTYGTLLTGTDVPVLVTGYQAGVVGAFLGDTAATAYSGTPLVGSAGLAARASVAGGPYATTIALGSLESDTGYALALNPSGLITITPKDLTAGVTASGKTYDGTTATTGTVTLNGILAGDVVGTSGTTFTFTNKNAGTGKAVNVAGTTLTGADASNYTVTVPATVLADILAKAITGSLTVNNKTYDGNTAGTGTVTLNGVVAGDAVGTTGTTFTFSDKNAAVGKTVTVMGTTLTGSDAGNYTLTVPTTALADILKKALVANVTADNKIYDGTNAATGSVTLNGVVSGDNVGTAGTTFAFADKNAGAGRTVNVASTTLIGTDAGNYTLAIPATVLADVLKKALTAGVTVNGKTYDGSTGTTGTVTLTGVLAGDTVGTAGTTFTFSDKNAGTGKTVSIAGTTLTGADAGNYALTIPASALADILKKAITGSITADSKTYDGSTAGTGSIALNGVIAGDSVGTTGSVFTFSDKNAGIGKTVNVTGTALNGADSGNYTLTLPASALADILQKALTATVSVNGKTYDGTTAATGTVSLNGVVAGDTVGTTGTVLSFADKNAGTGKTVNVTGTTLSGADSGNYTLTVPASALADILQKALTATVAANGKTYDGTTAATGSVALNGVVLGDSVGTTGSIFTFTDKHAGTGKTVNITGTTLTGTDSANYTVTVPTSALADILQKALTATVSANGKTYDGTTTATGSVALNGVVSGDSVGTGGSVFTFIDKNAGTGKTVNVTGTTLNGADSGNYTLTVPASALADILQKALTATVTANGKTYDGTTSASGSVALNGVVSGDAVGTTGSVFTFSDKNAGTGKTVNITGTALTGSDSGNYTLTVPASALADILQKALTANVTADGKTYDGTTTGTGSVALSGVIAGDSVSTGAITFTFADKNAGAGKAVAVGGTLSGADAGNYTVRLPATVLADILKKSLTATVSANGKTYDGTTAGTGSVALNGVVSGDVVSTGGITFTFADKNAGTGKAVAVGGSVSGADAGNYTVNLPAIVLADILQKALTATVTINGKTYDGTTAATGSVALNGVVAGDAVGTSGTAFAFTDKNAGTGKTVSVSGTTLTGTDSGNYTLTIPASVLADIAKRGLNLSADDKEKYSRDPDPALTYTITLGSLVAGDQLSGALTRADGEEPGKYAISQGSLSAGDNYTLTFTPGTLTISVDPATNQPQALRTLPLPSGIQAPPTAGSTVNIDAEALCSDDSSCVAN